MWGWGTWMSLRGGATRSLLRATILLLLLAHVAGNDFYRTLGLRRNADAEAIKKAHRDLVKKLHPDKSKSGDTTKRFQAVQRAYEVLSDPDKRKLYDQYGRDPDDPEVVKSQEAMRRDSQRGRHPMDDFFHRSRRQSYFVASRTQTLTADNYDSLVQGEQVWVIMVWREFNCERCIQVSDAWEEAAKQMSGIVNFGRINFDRQAALLHRYRIRQLPTFIAINSNKRDVTFFEYNRQVTVESLVDFASKCVPDGSLVYLKSAAAADQFLKSDPQKVHVILFVEEWAAFTSAASIPSFKEDMVFAFAPRWAPHGLNALFGQFNERTVVLVKDGGSFVTKSGIQSRKSLVRFLLKNKFMKVPRVTVKNYAQLCLGWGGPSEGLHFLPNNRNSSTVCVLSLRHDAKPAERPEVAAMLGMRDDFWSKVQFGWVDASDQPRLWEYLSNKAGKPKHTPYLLAAVDWDAGVTNIFDGGKNPKDIKANVQTWLENIAKSDEWLTEQDGSPVPGLQSHSNGFESMGLSGSDVVSSFKDSLDGMGLTRVLTMFVLIMAGFQALTSLLTSKPAASNSRRQQQQQQRPRQQQQQQQRQQEARHESRAGGGHSRSEAANGSGEGARQRPAASKANDEPKLEARLGECSVRELREFAEKHRINISDCSEKREIVSRILSNIR